MKSPFFRPFNFIFLSLIFFSAKPPLMHAGFLDKINEANKKMQDYANQQNQQQQGGGYSSGGGSLSAGLGATHLDGLTKFSDCQSEAIGYREGLIADRLELKLGNTPKLLPEERQEWLNDIAILRQVQQTRQPDRTNNQHYFLGLADQEQVAINSMTSKHNEEIRLKCEHSYGGMSRYSNTGQSDMQDQYEAEMAANLQKYQVTDIRSIPVEPLPSKLNEKTPEQLREEKRAARQAMQQQASQMANQCMEQTKGLRAKLLAQALQKKLDSGSVPQNDRASFQADIQAAWAAAGQGLSTVPTAEQRLNLQEQMDINNQYSQQSMQMMQSCTQAQMAARRSDQLT
jgi:hypothetical protein